MQNNSINEQPPKNDCCINYDDQYIEVITMQQHLSAAFITYLIDVIDHGKPADPSFSQDAKTTYFVLSECLKDQIEL